MIDVKLTKVRRYSYESKDGDIREGCVFDCLVPVEEDNDTVGFDLRTYKTKYSNYSKIVELYNHEDIVPLELEYVSMRNGNYYAKAISLGDIEL